MSQSVRIIFTRNWLPGSLLIRAATWSRWSHCALIVGDEVIESVMGYGVRRRALADLIAASSAHNCADLPVQDAAAVIEAAETQIGARYDWTGALGIALRLVRQDRDAWFCSELLAWAAYASGSPWFRRDRIGRVTPEHLWMLAPISVPNKGP